MQILKLLVIHAKPTDRLVRHFSPSRQYTAKMGYKVTCDAFSVISRFQLIVLGSLYEQLSPSEGVLFLCNCMRNFITCKSHLFDRGLNILPIS